MEQVDGKYASKKKNAHIKCESSLLSWYAAGFSH